MTPLIVHLHGKMAGVLGDDGQRMVFRYDDAWLADAGAVPLSRQLPLQSEPFEGQRVSVFFGGLLPEADVRDQIARNLGISANNDFAMLGKICRRVLGTMNLPGVLPELQTPDVREIVTRRAERMLGLLMRTSD